MKQCFFIQVLETKCPPIEVSENVFLTFISRLESFYDIDITFESMLVSDIDFEVHTWLNLYDVLNAE